MTAAGHPKIPVIPVIAVMPSGKTAPASTERMDNRYSAIRACLFLQDETGSDVAAGIPHGFNLVPTWDEVDTPDFTDGRCHSRLLKHESQKKRSRDGR